jgi:hypothetical protein
MRKPQAAQVEPAKKAAALKTASSHHTTSWPREKAPRSPIRESGDPVNAPERSRASDQAQGPPDAEQVIELVPDPVVAKEFHTTLMGLWRWDHDASMAALGWPPSVKIRNRNHRVRRLVEQFKQTLIRQSIEERRRV